MTQTSQTHWKKNFNYDYLGSYSLDEGQEVVLTITKVTKTLVTGTNGQKDDCTVAHFKEAVNGEKKPMILNKTNCKAIETAYGTPYIEEWSGKKITLYVEPDVKAFGELVDALRIRPSKPIDKITLTQTSAKWKEVQAYFEKHGNIDGVLKHYNIAPIDIESLKKSTQS